MVVAIVAGIKFEGLILCQLPMLYGFGPHAVVYLLTRWNFTFAIYFGGVLYSLY